MNIINSGLNNITQAVDDWKQDDKENIDPNIVESINSKIEELSKIIKNEDSIKYKDLRNKVDRALEDLEVSLGKLKPKQQIQKVVDAVADLHAWTKPSALQPSLLEGVKAPIKIKLGLICDFDAADTNGALAGETMLFIEDKQVPFMTCRSILSARDLSLPAGVANRMAAIQEIREVLIAHQKDWDIYQSTENEEMLVFLPATWLPGKNDDEKLSALDLKTEGKKLKKITVEEALKQYPSHKTPLESFTNLFVEKPSGDKLFYLAGHGGSDTVGGMREEVYVKFLNFIESQRCRGLTINSCLSGGESSLLNLSPVKPEDQASKAKFEEKLVEHTFPTVVRSIGDFPTIGGDAAEKEIGAYFDELSAFLEGTVETTAPKFKKMVEKLEANLSKKPVNRIQVYIPPHGDAPGGFRSLGEQDFGYPLTYAKLKAKKLEPVLKDRHLSKKDVENLNYHLKPQQPLMPIEINQEFLDIHPLIVDVPIKFKTQDAILLSMVPGNSQHFMKSIELYKLEDLYELDPLSFIAQTFDFHQTSEIGVSKSFFIGSIKYDDQIVTDVAMLITPQGSKCVFKFDDNYYISDGQEKPLQITALQHALFVKEAQQSTIPSAAAVRASSGGQESVEMLSEILEGPEFWSSEDPFVQKFKTILKEQTFEPLLNFADGESISLEDKQNLCIFLLKNQQEDLALEFFKTNKLDPNMKDMWGCPLLCLTLQNNQFLMARYLMENGADLSALNVEGQTPLHIAIMAIISIHQKIESNSIEQESAKLGTGEAKSIAQLAEWLIHHIDILEVEDKQGLTPLCYSVLADDTDLIKLLMSKGCSMDYENSHRKTMLNALVEEDLVDKAEFVLNASAVPPSPSALNLAIKKNNVDLVNKMLEKGGNPFAPDTTKTPPLIEAIMQGNQQLVEIFLDLPKFNPNETYSKGLHSLVAALFSGNQHIVQALLNKKIKFPEVLSEESSNVLKKYVVTCAKLGLKDKLQQLFALQPPLADELLEPVWLQVFKQKNIQLCKDLIEAIQPNLNNHWDKLKGTIFQKVIQLGEKDLVVYCLEHGATLTSPNNIELYEALKTGNVELVDVFCSHGCKFSEDFFLSSNIASTAFQYGKLPMLIKVLELAKELQIDLNKMDVFSKNMLWESIFEASPEIALQGAECLLQNGISPDKKSAEQIKKLRAETETT